MSQSGATLVVGSGKTPSATLSDIGEGYDKLVNDAAHNEALSIWFPFAHAYSGLLEMRDLTGDERAALEAHSDLPQDEAEGADAVFKGHLSGQHLLLSIQKQSKFCCNRCGDIKVKMSACGKCKHARYCGARCQTADWRSHKRVCPHYAEHMRQRRGESTKQAWHHHLFLADALQMQRPRVCRFWLATLIHALRPDSGSDRVASIALLSHVARFLWLYTSACVPPLLQERLEALRNGQTYVLGSGGGAATQTAPTRLPILAQSLNAAVQMDAELTGNAILGSTGYAWMETPGNDPFEHAHTGLNGTLHIVSMHEPHFGWSLPWFSYLEHDHPFNHRKTKALRSASYAFGSGLVGAAYGPLCHPKLCNRLLGMWSKKSWWADRSPGAGLLCDIQTFPPPQPGVSQIPQAGYGVAGDHIFAATSAQRHVKSFLRRRLAGDEHGRRAVVGHRPDLRPHVSRALLLAWPRVPSTASFRPSMPDGPERDYQVSAEEAAAAAALGPEYKHLVLPGAQVYKAYAALQTQFIFLQEG